MPEAPVTKVPKEKKFRLVEIKVDEFSTIRRLVPEDTDEEDLPEGAEMFSTEETEVMLRRRDKPVKILRGHQVRLHPVPGSDPNIPQAMGTVDTILKSGKVRVTWDNGSRSRHETSELDRVY